MKLRRITNDELISLCMNNRECPHDGCAAVLKNTDTTCYRCEREVAPPKPWPADFTKTQLYKMLPITKRFGAL